MHLVPRQVWSLGSQAGELLVLVGLLLERREWSAKSPELISKVQETHDSITEPHEWEQVTVGFLLQLLVLFFCIFACDLS